MSWNYGEVCDLHDWKFRTWSSWNGLRPGGWKTKIICLKFWNVYINELNFGVIDKLILSYES
jgi:hypothetical protein